MESGNRSSKTSGTLLHQLESDMSEAYRRLARAEEELARAEREYERASAALALAEKSA